jgi:probable phosphoglycerate mutase
MTRILLLRHAATDMAGRQLSGRTEAAPLNAAGLQQARRLARALAAEKSAVVYTSPRERARQTADILGRAWGAAVTVASELDEVDYGDWSGRGIDELRSVAAWRAFNSIRSCTRIPNGELMADVQARVVRFLQGLRERHPLQTVAAVSHAETVRAALVYYLGAPLDLMLRLEVSQGSVSIVEIDDDGPIVSCVNCVEALQRA